MSYQVIARKWRPQTFDEVSGQEHVKKGLRNAILTGRIPHAILLTGPRGVGVVSVLVTVVRRYRMIRPVVCSVCTQVG